MYKTGSRAFYGLCCQGRRRIQRHVLSQFWGQSLLFFSYIECLADDKGEVSYLCIRLAAGPYRAFTVKGGGGYRDMSCNSSGVRGCYLSVILSV